MQLGIPPKGAAMYIEMYKSINAGVPRSVGSAFEREHYSYFAD